MPGDGDRQCDPAEAREFRVSEGRRHVQHGRVYCAKCRPGRHDQKWGGTERLGQHDAGQRHGKTTVEELAQVGVGPHEVDEQYAAHQRGEGERQHHDQPDEGRHPTRRSRQHVGQGHPEQRDESQGDRGALERDEERWEQARVAEASILCTHQSNEKADDRYGEVEDDQPPEPRQGALYEPPTHYFKAASTPMGANSSPVTLGVAATTPFLARIFWPALPSKKFTKATAAASCGALLRMVMV